MRKFHTRYFFIAWYPGDSLYRWVNNPYYWGFDFWHLQCLVNKTRKRYWG